MDGGLTLEDLATLSSSLGHIDWYAFFWLVFTAGTGFGLGWDAWSDGNLWALINTSVQPLLVAIVWKSASFHISVLTRDVDTTILYRDASAITIEPRTLRVRARVLAAHQIRRAMRVIVLLATVGLVVHVGTTVWLTIRHIWFPMALTRKLVLPLTAYIISAMSSLLCVLIIVSTRRARQWASDVLFDIAEETGLVATALGDTYSHSDDEAAGGDDASTDTDGDDAELHTVSATPTAGRSKSAGRAPRRRTHQGAPTATTHRSSAARGRTRRPVASSNKAV